MTNTAPPRRRTRSRRFVPGAALSAVAAILALSACSGSDNADNAGSLMPRGAAAAVNKPGVEPVTGFGSSQPGGGSAQDESATRGGTDVNTISAVDLSRAQIKKALIGLRSNKVATVVSSIETIASAQGGFIDSEDTATDAHGVALSSSITLRVPVDAFDETVDAVARLGSLQSKKTTTVDVTGQLADVASRVSSAKDSIAQLRVLFNHATKLGDIIALESELSARESDLEALEAQQRVLTAQTSLSTISVSVSRDDDPASKSDDDEYAGFLGGLHQGWDALVSAFDEVAHAVGAALPIAVTVLVLGFLGWIAVRRLPRRRAETSG